MHVHTYAKGTRELANIRIEWNRFPAMKEVADLLAVAPFAGLVLAIVAGIPAAMHYFCIQRVRKRFPDPAAPLSGGEWASHNGMVFTRLPLAEYSTLIGGASPIVGLLLCVVCAWYYGALDSASRVSGPACELLYRKLGELPPQFAPCISSLIGKSFNR